jgi:hypothetical protein
MSPVPRLSSMGAAVVLAVLAFQVVYTELHPVPLVEACPAPRPK